MTPSVVARPAAAAVSIRARCLTAGRPAPTTEGMRIPVILAPALGAILLAGIAGQAAASSPQPPRCHGLEVTVEARHGTVRGTPGADVILLDGAADVEAGAGADVICGSPRPDAIDAGPGADVVLGGGGADQIQGGPGRDALYGEGDGDAIVGGAGPDLILAGAGRDRVARGARDRVGAGVQGVSLIASHVDVDWLRRAGLRVGVARQRVGVFPVWATFAPMMSNMLTWSDDYGVYGSLTTLRPGYRLLVQSPPQPAPLGSRWGFAPWEFAPRPGGRPGEIAVINESTIPFALGLDQPLQANGAPRARAPLSARSVGWNVATSFSPSTVALFVTGEQPGTLVDGLPRSGAAVELTREAPTAAFILEGGAIRAAPTTRD